MIMRKDCDTCLHNEFGETYCNNCYWAYEKPPTKWEPAPFWAPDTNADRIRAMSDEELAKFLADEIPHGDCYGCDLECATFEGDKFENDCHNAFYRWLKQPAEE
jgi:hypothetical protein